LFGHGDGESRKERRLRGRRKKKADMKTGKYTPVICITKALWEKILSQACKQPAGKEGGEASRVH